MPVSNGILADCSVTTSHGFSVIKAPGPSGSITGLNIGSVKYSWCIKAQLVQAFKTHHIWNRFFDLHTNLDDSAVSSFLGTFRKQSMVFGQSFAV